MSEKKAPDNKREKEKERLIHVTEEQLQAGKAEIMKIVAGLNGAEKLADLLDKGRKKGNLSSNELMDALEEIDLESDQMDNLRRVGKHGHRHRRRGLPAGTERGQHAPHGGDRGDPRGGDR